MAFVAHCGVLSLAAQESAGTSLVHNQCSALVCASRSPARARRARGVQRGPAQPPTCAAKDLTFSDSLNGENFRIGIVWTRWNVELVGAMVEDVRKTLRDIHVKPENIVEMQVPGTFEIPMASRLMCATQKVDAIVCVGVLIKGETDHYEYIAGPVSAGLMDLQLSTNIPIVFGVLTCRDRAQAEARSIGEKSHATDWARTAVEMALLRSSQVSAVFSGRKSVGF